MAMDRLAVGDEVLELAGRGVAGPHQDEEALPLAGRHLDEGGDAVDPQVRVDRQGVDVPRGLERPADGDLAQVRPGISLGGRADVVPLAVHQDDQAGRLGMLGGRVQGRDPFGPIGLVEGGLELDRRDEGGHDVDDLAAELLQGRATPARSPGKPSRKPTGRSSGLGSIPTQTGLPTRTDRRHQGVREMHEDNLRQAALTDQPGFYNRRTSRGKLLDIGA